jgi:TPR repeat protein
LAGYVLLLGTWLTRLGYFHHQGIAGVSNSQEGAITWLKKAVQLGSKEAMHYYALLLLDDKELYDPEVQEFFCTGFTKFQEAMALLEAAVAEPSPSADAAYLLGDIYLHGNEVVSGNLPPDIPRFLIFLQEILPEPWSFSR